MHESMIDHDENDVSSVVVDVLQMEWDDGHVPESLVVVLSQQQKCQDNNNTATTKIKQYMRIYPKYHGGVPECYTKKNWDYTASTNSSNDLQNNANNNTVTQCSPLLVDDGDDVSKKISSSTSPASTSFIYCIDSALPLQYTYAIYEYTQTQTQTQQQQQQLLFRRKNTSQQSSSIPIPTTWGTYITMKQIQHYWDTTTAEAATKTKHWCRNNRDRNHDDNHNNNRNDTDIDSLEQLQLLDQILLPAASYFIKHYITLVEQQHLHNKGENATLHTTPGCNSHDDDNDEDSKKFTSHSYSKNLFRQEKNINRSHCCTDSEQRGGMNTSTRTIVDDAHGVAVWVLSSTIGSEVPYHIDYAELLRYETGLIVPPVIAGTLHCTPPPAAGRAASLLSVCTTTTTTYVSPPHTVTNSINSVDMTRSQPEKQHQNDFDGGSYCVVNAVHGLDHYYKHGYKGKLQQPIRTTSSAAGITELNTSNNRNSDDVTAMTNDSSRENQNDDVTIQTQYTATEYIEIPYNFNRMICQSGHLPHWSTKMTSPLPNHDDSVAPTTNRITDNNCSNNNENIDNNDAVRRVIVGFNVFLHDIGPIVQEAPEHSDAFRRRVIQQQQQRKQQSNNMKNNNNNNFKTTNISLETLQSNPKLRQILVLAKREKHKQELLRAKEDLDKQIQNYIRSKQQESSIVGVTVEELLNVFDPTKQMSSSNHDYITDENMVTTASKHNSNRIWPKDVMDIHVHLHTSCKKGTYGCIRNSSDDKNQDPHHHKVADVSTNSFPTKLIGKDWLIQLAE